MIVDDELDIVESIKIWLQKRGFNFYGFTNPLLALEYFKNNCNSIDIVLSDIRMPQMNGYELVKRISKLQNAFEINHSEMARVLPNIKINSIVSEPVSLKNLTKTIDENLK